ncbi:hypothetical protein B5F07_04610 [Lachnoclostridium sp. An169]|uniref:hypothetical protein n=1 Tax=Lachnoclostridium sp. An169 TaxID=1965569 RepID=UPI000B388C3E|nr:hypothetical protein [Lachnoclostridium sp. An169]OUP85431.1 hypothetical protein B5F07_04610 [Lachnoclostridium sp. An169]
MKGTVRKTAAVIFTAFMTLAMLCGCARDFDAEGYVKACLDALYMREYDAYADMVGISADEAKSDLEGDFQSTVDEAFLGDTVTSEEDKQAYSDAIVNVYKLAKYEVTGSVEKDGNYVVTVEVQPCMIFANLEEEMTARAEQAVADGTYDETKYIASLNGYLNDAVSSCEYGDTQEVQVNVTRDEDNVYTISEADLTYIEGALFPGAV